jgi:hypothetical protein
MCYKLVRISSTIQDNPIHEFDVRRTGAARIFLGEYKDEKQIIHLGSFTGFDYLVFWGGIHHNSGFSCFFQQNCFPLADSRRL